MMPFRVVGLGEVLWDLLPTGPQLGGAPANFAYHAHALGAHSCVVSRIGNDQLGQDVLARFHNLGLPVETIQTDPAAATGTVVVTLSPEGLPEYTIKEGVSWDHLAITDAALEVVRNSDAVCFGTLAQRNPISRSTIQQLVGSAKASSLRVLDLNLRQHYYSRQLVETSLSLANVLKLNEDELTVLAQMFHLTGDMRSLLSQLAERYQLQVAACTRGADGSAILAGDHWSECAGVSTKVIDTIGAGDAFTAAMVIGLLLGWGLDKVNECANQVAAFVASCPGATPQLPTALVGPFRSGS